MAAQLPQRLPLEMMQQKWASQLNPLLANNLNNVSILSNISLKAGINVINHMLGEIQQGWFLVDVQGPSVIYRSAAFNASTLTLTSSADVVASIGVF